MTLYIESNYVLKMALGQEESGHAERLLAAGERGLIEMTLPAFALSEPFSAVTARIRERGRMIRQFNVQIDQLARSSPHQQDVTSLRPVPNAMARIDKREADHRARTIERLLGTARRIETDLAVFRQALTYQTRFDLEAQDAIILSAVITDLRARGQPGPHYFANRNRKDFDIPGIHLALRPFGCTMVFSFAEAGRLLGI